MYHGLLWRRWGAVLLDGQPVQISSPRAAQAHDIGMVYQYFTLVPCVTAAENLVMVRADAPAVINLRTKKRGLEEFMDRMPFRERLEAQVADLSAGKKQKLEILKLLSLDQRLLILDELTSVMTLCEADEVLTLLRRMAGRQEITVLMISYKFHDVKALYDSFAVLRRGRVTGSGDAQSASVAEMSRMIICEIGLRARAPHIARAEVALRLVLEGISAEDEAGRQVIDGLSPSVGAGEILGIAGVSGDGQAAFVDGLAGQRPLCGGRLLAEGQILTPRPRRADQDRYKLFGLPEELPRNATVPRMSVAENMAFRCFDKAPAAGRFGYLSPARIMARSRDLIRRYNVRTSSPDARIETLSGGNVQRAVLAREFSGDVDVLILANPCFGLDSASVAEIRAQIMEQRSWGAPGEDLDEILKLSDRVAVMSAGRLVPAIAVEATERSVIGRQMGDH